MGELAANESYYVEEEPGTFRPSELTRGPWSAEHQHAGPPAALIARAIERCPDPRDPAADPVTEFNVGRITLEILAPIPLEPLRAEATVVRPGKRVQMLEARLETLTGEIVVEARGWRIRAEGLDIPVGLAGADAGGVPSLAGRPTGGSGPPTPPSELEPASGENWFPDASGTAFHSSMDYRLASGGSFTAPGPASCWMRMRYPLVAGEQPTPLERVMAAADSGNGISATLDIRTHLFINVDLSVHLHRLPAGEWICLDSVTVPEPTGLGMADTMLWDEQGPLGRALQTLLISERG